MCGRFTLKAKPGEIAAAFGLLTMPTLGPRYNVAPTQEVAAVRIDRETGRRRLDLLRWGFVPGWADDPAIGNRMINARAETVAEKPAFRHAFKARRCLIVADGFYEWQRQGGRKVPHHIRLHDQRPFAFAGLWERWRRDGAALESCAVITTEPNDVLRPIHDRMPVILGPEDYAAWLDPSASDAAALKALLRPFPAADMVAVPVGTLVNAPANDRPECLRPVA
jgi:putative SOS response-associated peptidase YedK